MESENKKDRLHEDLENGNYWIDDPVYIKKDIAEFSDQAIERQIKKFLKKIEPNDIVTRIEYEFFDDSSSRQFSYGYFLIGTTLSGKVRFGEVRIILEPDVEHLEVRRYIPNHKEYYFWNDIFEKIIKEVEMVFGKPRPSKHDPLDKWFDYKDSIYGGITLQRISEIKNLSYSYVRHQHSSWRAENKPVEK